MTPLLRLPACLVHLQVVMALSAVAYIETACLLLQGHGAPPGWLLAAFLGTLGLYVLDGVRSAEREDALSQSARATLSRRYRGVLSCLGLLGLVGAGVLVALQRPSGLVWLLLGVVGLLGLAHLLPLFPRGSGLTRTKDLALLKPLLVSASWLLGGLLVTGASDGSVWSEAREGVAGFALVTLPLLLLDSLWLDRRDRLADARFGVHTLAARLAPRPFRGLSGLLLVSTLLGVWWLPGGWWVLGWFWAGAVWLALLPPDQLRSEAVQVLLAALWRFTGLFGAWVWVTPGP